MMVENGSYSVGVLNFVKEKNPLPTFLSKYEAFEEGQKAYLGHCPFCNAKKKTFAISKARNVYHCFSCGESGDIYSYLMKKEKMSLAQATRFLANEAKIRLPKIQAFDDKEQQELFEINKQAALFYVHTLFGQDTRGLAYLKEKRKLDLKTITQFGLGYARNHNELTNYLLKCGYSVKSLLASGLVCEKDNRLFDRFRGRIIFPILNEKGRVIGFNGRVLGEFKPKYLNTPETLLFDKGRLFYGMQNLKKDQPIVLCEGNFDVIACTKSGVKNVVATLGTSLSEHHIDLIKSYTDTLYLMYDSDTAGQNATKKALSKWQEILTIKVVDLAPYKDPDEALRNGESLMRLVKSALSAEDFLKRKEKTVS